MKLGSLLKPLGEALRTNCSDRSISGLALDSRQVRPGHLFAVVPGPRCDGARYVPDAISRGAVAILAARKMAVPGHIALVVVPDVRQALADLCCRFHGRPADLVKTVGVTGTNGKTTVATLVHDLLATAGKQAALLSTVVHQVGTRRIASGNTTPESPELQAFFAEMVERRIGHAVMEVSSHSLAQDRVRGIPFEVGAYTNATPHEHLDYHVTFESYLAAKARLFESLAPEATAVVNADDPHCAYFVERRGRGKVMSYGLQGGADVSANIETMSLAGTALRLSTPQGQRRVHSPLIGGYNVQNLLAGTCCALALGLDLSTIAEGIERFAGARGRLERVDAGQPFSVLVDYAHNNDGLRSVLSTLRPLAAPGRLIAVFGCGGDRDRSKRPLMGATASRLAHVTVLTADNSRSEHTEEILMAIVAGLDPKAQCLVEPDRREAIRKAIGLAEPGDLVLIAGKGHETYQEIDGVRYPFDDCDEARRALQSLALRRAREAGRSALSATGIG